ncbi:MAG: NUDIX domain-containing protein [Spirochaetaceae bacterium]|nr:NUDIX domain-containing protein [Spirochaetaceae bacterium]
MSLNQSIAGIVIKEGKILVMKRLPKGIMANKWEFPGGKLEQGETPEEAMKREWLEELEVPVSLGPLLAESNFIHDDKEFLLLSYQVFPENENWVFHEHSECRWLPVDQLQSIDLAESDLIAARIMFPDSFK